MVLPTRKIGVLKGHTGPVHCVTYSSGAGSYVLTGGSDRKIHLFSPSKQSLIQTFSAHGYPVLSLTISPDNSTFASSGGDKLVFLWDVTSASTTRRFEGHWGQINAVAFNEDASVVVSGSYDATVRFWDVKSSGRKEIMKLDEAKDAIMAVAVRGCEVYAGSVDGRVRCYDVRMGRATVDVVCTKGVTAVKPTRDGRGVLVAGLDAKVRVMDKATGRCLQTLKGHENSEFRVGCCWAEEESVVVSGSEEGGVWCWDVTTAEAKRVLRGHGTDGKGRKVVSCVDAKKGGGEIVSGGNDGDVIVWGV